MTYRWLTIWYLDEIVTTSMDLFLLINAKSKKIILPKLSDCKFGQGTPLRKSVTRFLLTLLVALRLYRSRLGHG